MIRTLIKNWWLLLLAGILQAVMSVEILARQGTGFHSWSTVVFIGRLGLAAGACTVAAGLWHAATGASWLLVLNGLAQFTLGLILNAPFGSRIRFSTIACLIILMAVTLGILAWTTGRTLRTRNHVAESWLFIIAGAASIAFSLLFLALGFRWVTLEPGSTTDLVWQGTYFAFMSVCMFGLGLRLHSHGLSLSAFTRVRPVY